ncbi:hypothetical protein CYG49_02535 [Candidatus Saccharibacteria bacterium]|nr:MAG: hypothetical protein CYG49_02535 [Candidatus Saccharibacteria bacterium]
MSVESDSPYSEKPLSPEEARINALHRVLEAEVKDPTGSDSIIAAMCEAFIYELQESPLKEVVNDACRYRQERRGRDIQPRNLMNLMIRAVQKQMLKHYPNYPNSSLYEISVYWQHIILRNMYFDEAIMEELFTDIALRDVQTNLPDRYKSHKLIALSEVDRLGEQPTMIDIGTSDLQGPNKLRLDGTFSDIKVVEATCGSVLPALESTQQAKVTTNRRATALVNDVLRRSFSIGPSLGIDRVRRDLGNDEWVFACSFRPKDLRNQEHREEYQALMSKVVPGVDFTVAEITEQGIKPPIDRKAKIVTNVTTSYLLSPKERQVLREVSRELVEDDGLIIHQDFMWLPEGSDEFVYYEKWVPWTYQTFVEDPRTNKVLPVFQWETGRTRSVRLLAGLSKFAIGESVKPLLRKSL